MSIDTFFKERTRERERERERKSDNETNLDVPWVLCGLLSGRFKRMIKGLQEYRVSCQYESQKSLVAPLSFTSDRRILL